MIYKIITALIVLVALISAAIKIFKFFKDKDKKKCKSCPYKGMCQPDDDECIDKKKI